MKQKLLHIIMLLSIVAMTTGCAGWRTIRTIETVQPPSSFTNSQNIGSFGESPWWIGFQDSTLNRVMDELFESNLSLEQSVARLDQFRSMHAMANGSWFPSLNGQLRIQDNGNVDPDLPMNPAMQLNRYDASLTTMYELDLWGKLSANRQAAYQDLLANTESLEAFKLSLSAQLAKAYYGVVSLQLQLDLSEKTVESYKAYNKLVQGRYDRGVTSSLDVYQAQINLAGAESRKAQLEAGLSTAEHGLSVLLGRYPEADILSKQITLPLIMNPISEGLPSELIQRRPDVRSVYHRMIASDRRWAEAIASRFPSFSLTATLGGRSDELSTALDPNSMLWSAIGGLAIPIFQGGKLKANADRTQAAYDEQVAGYKLAVLTAFMEVENALVRGEKQLKTVSKLEEQVSAAESSLGIATDRYLRGLATYLQVVNAQTAYFNASNGLITARKDLIDSRIGLVTALGGAWE